MVSRRLARRPQAGKRSKYTQASGQVDSRYCGRPGVIPFLAKVLDGHETGAFSTITELELWQSIRPGEEERHEALLALLERIPLDGAIARRAGQLRQQVGLERLSLPDAAIAASAEQTGRRLLTRNRRDLHALEATIEIEFYTNK